MYFLVERAKDSTIVRIVRNFESIQHLPVHLKSYLDDQNIKYVKEEKEMSDDKAHNLYCMNNGLHNFKIIRKFKYESGYIFNGYDHYDIEFYLEVVFYKIIGDNIYQVKNEIESDDDSE